MIIGLAPRAATLRQYLQAINAGELNIQQNKIDALTVADFERFLAAGCSEHAHPGRFNDHLDGLANAGVVVRNEDIRAGHHGDWVPTPNGFSVPAGTLSMESPPQFLASLPELTSSLPSQHTGEAMLSNENRSDLVRLGLAQDVVALRVPLAPRSQ